MHNIKPVFRALMDEDPEAALTRCIHEQRSQITDDIWLILLVTLTDVIAQKNSPDTLLPVGAGICWEGNTNGGKNADHSR